MLSTGSLVEWGSIHWITGGMGFYPLDHWWNGISSTGSLVGWDFIHWITGGMGFYPLDHWWNGISSAGSLVDFYFYFLFPSRSDAPAVCCCTFYRFPSNHFHHLCFVFYFPFYLWRRRAEGAGAMLTRAPPPGTRTFTTPSFSRRVGS